MFAPELTLFFSLAVGFLLLRRSFGAFTLHNPAALFFLGHVLLLGAGGLYRIIYANAVPINDVVIYIVALSIFQYTAGVYLSSRLFYSRQNYLFASVKLLRTQPLAYMKSNLFICIAAAIPAFFFVVFYIKAGGFVWLMEDMDNTRMEVRRGLGPITLLGIASSFVSSLIVIHHTKPRLIIGLAIITIFSFFAGSYGNRAPAGFVFVSSLYYYFFIKNKPSTLLLASMTLVIFCSLMALNILRQGLDASILSATQQALWRPFVNFQNLNIIYEQFYLKNDIQYGASFIRDLAVFIPGINQNNSEWIKEYLGMNFSGGGITITYLGELILNFSVAPLFFVPLLLGVILQTLFIAMLRFRVSALFMLIVSFSSMAIVSSGIIPPIINMLAPMLIIYTTIIVIKIIFIGATKPLHEECTRSSG